ncbi:MAG: hypothetical protein JRF40_12045, partial [Deltaproteobacteria bacterium]|nr:hypothetical protein [Deltaproteobacteria bacterium]
MRTQENGGVTVTGKISSLIIAILIILTATQQAFCAGLTVFGPEDFETGEWHFELARKTFSVNNPGDGIIRVTKTDPEKVPDDGFLIFNFRLIPLRKFFNGDDLVFEKDVPLKSYNRMLIFFRGTPGTPIRISVSNEGVQIPLPEVEITAYPETIVTGQITTLSWTSSWADSCVIEPDIGVVNTEGSLDVAPAETTNYTITVTGSGGTRSANVIVTVIDSPEITIIEPDGIDDIADESFTISWTDEDPDSNASIALYYDMDNTGTEEYISQGTYEYTDSRDPGGPVYNWIDITTDGTEVELSRNDSVEVMLPFEFPFYGENKTSVRIGSNGYLTFGSDGDSSYNGPIPDAGTPNDIIAICWESLNPMYGGTIHYY